MARRGKMKVHGGRAFLNDPGHYGMASMIAEIQDSSTVPDEDRNSYWEPHVNFIIADCDRKIQLDFDVSTPEDIRNSVRKVDTMLRLLTGFREGLVAEADLAKKRAKE